jgi:uncharacterized membrane protein SpoIIM required for sporulation
MPRSVFEFVRTRKQRWNRLDALCERVERSSLSSLPVDDLREMGSLYRQATSDLAYVQTFTPDSELVELLNALVARAHSLVYISSNSSWKMLWRTISQTWPQTFRANVRYFYLSLAIFLAANVMGAAGFLADEGMVNLFLGPGGEQLLESVKAGEMWTDKIFSVTPMSHAALNIMVNNIMVVFLTFTMGIALGLGTVLVLVRNGLMLGAVIAMCVRYGMALSLFDFITAHGVVEISVIIVAGGAGLMLGESLLCPGRLSRRDALRSNGPQAIRLVIMGAFVLVFAGLTEGFISPVHSLPSNLVPTILKICFGIFTGSLFYLYLFKCGRKTDKTTEFHVS